MVVAPDLAHGVFYLPRVVRVHVSFGAQALGVAFVFRRTGDGPEVWGAEVTKA